DYLDNEPIKDLEIKYSFDGDKLLGTGGAIKKAMSLLDENFFIMYGDSYLDTDFQKVDKYFFSENKSGLMTVFRNNDRYDKSNIEFEDNKIINYNKKDLNENMKFIDYGLGILTAKAFKDFENEMVFDLEQVYRNLLFQNELLGYEVEERFYEIGSFQGLEETNKYLMTNKN
ncbi:MAG: nucleotidyl transferase, partial [Bacteroidota bacterium]|nr:nucleotidyl transferase [Bacteroidota bacterium]